MDLFNGQDYDYSANKLQGGDSAQLYICETTNPKIPLPQFQRDERRSYTEMKTLEVSNLINRSEECNLGTSETRPNTINNAYAYLYGSGPNAAGYGTKILDEDIPQWIDILKNENVSIITQRDKWKKQYKLNIPTISLINPTHTEASQTTPTTNAVLRTGININPGAILNEVFHLRAFSEYGETYPVNDKTKDLNILGTKNGANQIIRPAPFNKMPHILVSIADFQNPGANAINRTVTFLLHLEMNIEVSQRMGYLKDNLLTDVYAQGTEGFEGVLANYPNFRATYGNIGGLNINQIPQSLYSKDLPLLSGRSG